MISYSINFLYKKFKLDVRCTNKIKKICACLQKDLPHDSLFEISFIDDAHMQKLNNQYAHTNKTTDVLSFSINHAALLGEVFISVPYAMKETKRLKISFDDEILLLVCHGLLHLLGYDHDTPKNRALMFEKQTNVLKLLRA
jgi:probable rRNA maturation factor